MFNRWIGLLALLLIASGCATATPTLIPTTTPTLAPTSIPATPTRYVVSTTETRRGVNLAIFTEQGATALTTSIGINANIRVAFRPYKRVEELRSDGSTNRYETGWTDHNITEMRYCVDVGQTCQLPNEWKPFANEIRSEVAVRWIGLKDYGVTTQFRTASGEIIPVGFNALDVGSAWMSITGVIDDKTPIASQPPAIQTIIAQARAAFPVSGKIQVGEQSTMGGKAGTALSIKVKFEATSPQADVIEMRIKQSPFGRCLTPEEMSDASWEKFVAEKTYTYTPPINWSTFKLHVQYRDAKGNLSPVYCGEVAVEGNP
ncbi:MAG: hypothetical protein HZB51_03645 [Chloroflexi bacterium]|nr:hypothetical protein [Chloroflexota bacterium]